VAVPFVDAGALERRLPVGEAIDALEVAFRDGDPGAAPLRTHVDTEAGSLLLMPAAGPAGVGVKLVTVTPSNPSRGSPLIHAVYVLFDGATQAPRMLVDGSALTALRTAAVSGLATRHLARDDARRLVVFGAGVQARAHVDAIAAVRPVSSLVVVGRSRPAVDRLVALAGSRGIEARPGVPDDVAEADVVCTCTTATAPLFDGAVLAAGAHVNAVGAFQPATRELDTETVRRARVVVETREAAMAEAGDLLVPIDAGAIGADHVVADLQEVVRGAAVRTARDDVTVFESVGLAFEDLAVAGALAASP
jgi:ornithine cyclodeaminase/alanine dehydrogenase-like protein (mu-crystallin family)